MKKKHSEYINYNNKVTFAYCMILFLSYHQFWRKTLQIYLSLIQVRPGCEAGLHRLHSVQLFLQSSCGTPAVIGSDSAATLLHTCSSKGNTTLNSRGLSAYKYFAIILACLHC